MLLLATLLHPSRGRARIFGHDSVGERAAVRRHLGLVFQEASIDGLLTVEENLRFAAGLMGLGGRVAQRAVAAALERTGLARALGPRCASGAGVDPAYIARRVHLDHDLGRSQSVIRAPRRIWALLRLRATTGEPRSCFPPTT
jgi:ABC-type uncharacterized transport system YnjBCD ATPase subunit